MRRVCSTITTASAPAGMGAPVMISTACPGSDRAREPLARANLADDLQLAGKIDGAHGESVAHRARQRRRVAVGRDIFGEHASRGAIEPGLFDVAAVARTLRSTISRACVNVSGATTPIVAAVQGYTLATQASLN